MSILLSLEWRGAVSWGLLHVPLKGTSKSRLIFSEAIGKWINFSGGNLVVALTHPLHVASRNLHVLSVVPLLALCASFLKGTPQSGGAPVGFHFEAPASETEGTAITKHDYPFSLCWHQRNDSIPSQASQPPCHWQADFGPTGPPPKTENFRQDPWGLRRAAAGPRWVPKEFGGPGREQSRGAGILAGTRTRFASRALSHPVFGWEGSPAKIDYRKRKNEKDKKRYPDSWRT